MCISVPLHDCPMTFRSPGSLFFWMWFIVCLDQRNFQQKNAHVDTGGHVGQVLLTHVEFEYGFECGFWEDGEKFGTPFIKSQITDGTWEDLLLWQNADGDNLMGSVLSLVYDRKDTIQT